MSPYVQHPLPANALVAALLRGNRADCTAPVLPIAAAVGASLLGIPVTTLMREAQAQESAALALVDSFDLPALLLPMDLSLEAESFGCTLLWLDGEVPTVTGRLITAWEQLETMALPAVGAARTSITLEAVRRLAAHQAHVHGGLPVIVGMIGPFSLAGRLFGVNEIMPATITHAAGVDRLMAFVTQYLIRLAVAYKQAGATGILMAEPLAGLLSPRALGHFSSAWVRQIVHAVQDSEFGVILHNCGARDLHLPQMLEADACGYHFGRPMEMAAALATIPPDRLLCGNLDPASLFVRGTPEGIHAAATELLALAADRPTFILSSGCDLPTATPPANVAALVDAARTQSLTGAERALFAPEMQFAAVAAG